MSQVKLVVFGSGSVGKSAISVQFVQDTFLEGYDPSICDVYKKQETIDGETYVLEVVDTAGQEEYAALRAQYYQKGEGFIAVYSICDRKSFEEVQQMRDAVLRERSEDRVPMVLMANKCDLEPERKVLPKEGIALASNWFGDGVPIPFFESSAKDRINITEAFHEIVRQVKGTGTTPAAAPAAPAAGGGAAAPQAAAAEAAAGSPASPASPSSPEGKDKKKKKKKKKKCLVM
eukprot:TRINITY_DN9608_c1_g1_i1.p2 TRINITY_DN9608_c1_g1~~TRINITY_DN9608_c1_g1_i1.p2  ORF type:complete len:258 (+),score=120.35 TRINITY_DN9608_c1_g1_i1:80-775(+)